MADVAELGKRVKAKYPEYADLSDVEVGRKVKAKYPEYGDFADVSDAPQKSVGGFIENAWNSAKKAGGQIKSAVEHPLDTYNAMEPILDVATGQTFATPQKMAKAKKFADAIIEDYGNAYGSWDKALETLYQDPVRVGMDVASLVPGLQALRGARVASTAARMASTTGKVLKGAAKGAAVESMAPAKLPSVAIKGLPPLSIDTEVPAIVANAATGAVTGKFLGGTPGAVVGGAVGAARPIVRGAVRGGREALAEVRQAAANPPPLPVEPVPIPPRAAMSPVEAEWNASKAPQSAVAIDPDSTIGRASPKAQRDARDLAAMMGEDVAPPAGSPRFEDGARAKKAFNVLDTVEQLGADSKTVKSWKQSEWDQVVQATNDINTRIWEEGGKVGKAPDVHGIMGGKTKAEVVRLLKEIEARKATIQ